MSNINHKKIAIIGGGPGGLTLARLLQIQGADVTVYERDKNKDARMQGATLDLHDDSGLLAIREAGLMPEFIANYRPGADHLRITDKHANIVMDDDMNKEGYPGRPEIDRGPLQNLLLESLKPGTVVWDSHFAALTPIGDAWQLEFKNGITATANLVIGADGANSRVRPYVTPIKPFFAGVTAIEGLVHHSAMTSPKLHRLLHGGKIFAMGDEKTLIVSSKGDGSMAFYTSFKTNENWSKTCGLDFTDKTAVLAWFKQEYAGWSPIWDELFENTNFLIPRPQYCMPLDQTWAALPNLTLLGDAAHLMPPYAGEGVNMAMLDALELSKTLTDPQFTDLHQAIAAYENEMRIRASETADMTLISTAALHSPNAITFMMNMIG